jgi:hypothetical protein
MAAGEPGSDGVEAPGPTIDPDTYFDAPGLEPIDPCTLIDVTDWAHVNDSGPISEPIILEDGDACGWTNGVDTRRLAVSLTTTGFAAATGASGGEAIDGLGDSASWYPNWPVAQSSTLVVTINGKEFILELSAQDPADVDWLRSSAIYLAQDAINAGRVN